MKKYLRKLINWVSSLKWLIKQDCIDNSQEIHSDIKEMPLEDAFRMWKMEQEKEEAKQKPLTYGEALKMYLDSIEIFNNKQ